MDRYPLYLSWYTKAIRFPFSFLFPIILLLMIITLSSCTHVKRGDGPPPFHVDETKIPNAVPKTEPLAKYGNMRSYVVKGKRYYTMRSSKHYEAVGTASWYGTLFHAHRTSSGERYNMLSMTAAHKSLPLPTYVEVTNLKNNRKIIVKVNDRGPFKSNRLIDLSYVAAKKLGMLGRGTTTVKVKAIDPATYHRSLFSWPHWLSAKKSPSSKPIPSPIHSHGVYATNRSTKHHPAAAIKHAKSIHAAIPAHKMTAHHHPMHHQMTSSTKATKLAYHASATKAHSRPIPHHTTPHVMKLAKHSKQQHSRPHLTVKTKHLVSND